jgi:predicted acetyltransferase
MTKRAEKPFAHVELIAAAPEQKPILANLIELYAHDFSEFLQLDPGPDGRFGYKSLPLYWSEPERHPFLIRIDGNLAGFVFVKSGSEVSGNEAVWDMAEFFVIRGYRRRGVGTEIACEVWRSFPGRWEVRVLQSNIPASLFWARAISIFTGEANDPVQVEKNGQCWKLFRFESKPIS